MSDQEFREIQLSGKQLIFLFISAVVMAVVFFLLGVSVGRGVGGSTAVRASAGDPAATTDTVVAPAGAEAAGQPADLSYHRELQGQKPAAPETPAEPPPTAPPPQTAAAEPPPAGGSTTAAPPRNPSTGEVPPITPTLKPQAPTTSAPAAAGGFEVQAGAFNSKPNADALVAELKSKGFAAVIVPGERSQPRHIVRVGPYGTRAEAERAASDLAEQFKGRIKPSVISR